MAFGVVCEINKAKGLVRVDINGRVSNWLPCIYGTPSLGQQVALLEFENDGTGVVLGSTSRVDGNPISLHLGDVDIWCNGDDVKIKAQKIEIVGDVKIDGKLETTKDIKTEQKVVDSRGDLTNFSTTDGASRA